MLYIICNTALKFEQALSLTTATLQLHLYYDGSLPDVLSWHVPLHKWLQICTHSTCVWNVAVHASLNDCYHIPVVFHVQVASLMSVCTIHVKHVHTHRHTHTHTQIEPTLTCMCQLPILLTACTCICICSSQCYNVFGLPITVKIDIRTRVAHTCTDWLLTPKALDWDWFQVAVPNTGFSFN